MRDPRRRAVWRLDGREYDDTLPLASRLASLEPLEELRCHGVPLEALVLDVRPCRRTVADVFYRFFRLRPLPEADGVPSLAELPEEWESEAISIPREAPDAAGTKLSRFETEFALHTFLERVEGEIGAHLRRCSAPAAGALQRAPRSRPPAVIPRARMTS